MVNRLGTTTNTGEIVDYTDETAPQLSVVSPTPNTTITVADRIVTVKGSASDPTGSAIYASGVKSVECVLNGPGVTDAVIAANAETVNYGTWTAQVALPPYAPASGATYTITVRCTDGSGNVTTSLPITVIAKDQSAPSVAITEPSPSYVITDTSFTVRGTTSDDGGGLKIQSGIQRVEVIVNGVTVQAA